MVLQCDVHHLQPQQEFMCRLMNVLQYVWHYTLQKFWNNLLMVVIIFLNVCTFSITSTIFIKTLSVLWKRKVIRDLVFLDNLLKWNNWKIPVLLYWKPTYTDQYLCYSSYHQTSCKEVLFSPCLIEHIPLS